MEEKDKLKLLKRELKERIPYGVKVQIIDDNDCVMVCKLDKETLNFVGKWDIKPYLRSIGTMTDSEKREYWECYHEDTTNPISSMKPGEHKLPSFEKSNEYLKKRMFDYNGLIPAGIALEAPKDLY